MKHSREQVALASATLAVEALTRWLLTDSPDRWRHKFDSVAHAADALELCWKIRKRVPEEDRVYFRDAGAKVGLAHRPDWWSTRLEFIHPYLETCRNVRNSRHASFDDGAVPREYVMQALGSLFLEIELATGQRLERCVLENEWLTIRQTPDAAHAIEDAVRMLPRKTAYPYLRCDACAHDTFDSHVCSCRLCFHTEPTFICHIDGTAAYVRERRSWLPAPFDKEAKAVCRCCFEKLGKERVAYVMSDRSKVDFLESLRLGPKELIVACPDCGLRCLHLESTCCLLCGTTNEDWCLTDLMLRGLTRCEECRAICSPCIRQIEGGERIALCHSCEAARVERSWEYDEEEIYDDLGWECLTEDD